MNFVQLKLSNRRSNHQDKNEPVLFYLSKMDHNHLLPLRPFRQPGTLYRLCLTNVVNYIQRCRCDRSVLQSLPDTVLLDVYIEMLQGKRLCVLGAELSNLNIFGRLLRNAGSHLSLLMCFQSKARECLIFYAVVEHGTKLSTDLASSYLQKCEEQSSSSKDQLIELGIRLGGFLNEAGWYADASRVLTKCRKLCLAQPQTTYYKRLALECCHRLLNTESAYCLFDDAAETYSIALNLMGISEDDEITDDFPTGAFAVGDSCDAAVQTETNEEHLMDSESESGRAAGRSRGDGMWGAHSLCARLCKEFSSLFFVRCDYNLAHHWAMRALRLLNHHTPPKIIIDVLRCCAKACVVKRRFECAGVAATAAVTSSREVYGLDDPRYAAALLDYGFYLLNIDSIVHSVTVYEEALTILRRIFGRSSLHVATAQEDLAYALYVLEYSSGRFYKARDHAERAIRIIENLVPPDHLLLASAKRVKALILEEIALDIPAGQDMSEPSLLEESESLHKAALALSMMAFGENNVQTAKHYGNLGRLYQSMQKFSDAETMHLKAIAIKEELLGPEDYEVGLSVGHLASLYNYHMNMHHAAEKLYLRSISISLKLFGSRYSGLEYDYRGLVHVFTELKRHDRADHYTGLLQQWQELRELTKDEDTPVLSEDTLFPLEEIRAKFFGSND